MAYLTFGEDFINERSSNDIRFKFTGKERDSETGMDYFGARYYMSDLSIWDSVDPLASKYPSMSPFMYCGGNPVVLIDPDGMRFIDSQKNRVKVRVKRDGTIKYKFKKGTSEAVQKEFKDNHAESLEAMATTKGGRKTIRRMNRMITSIQIKPDETTGQDNATTYPTLDEEGEPIVLLDRKGDVYDGVIIVPHMGSIKKRANEDNVDVAEILGATMVVEAGHLEAKQIKLDNHETKSGAEKYYKLFNSYVRFRYNYRKAKNQRIDQTVFRNNSRYDVKLNRRNRKLFKLIK